MSPPRQLRRTSTQTMSVLMIIIGVALLVRTVAAGGGALSSGIFLGLLFVAAGAARIFLAQKG